MTDRQILKLTDVSFGVIAHDRVTNVKGTITGKFERMSGMHSVAIEGLDSTGRAFCEYVDLDRLELDA
jgi:hypothetical protein